MAGLYQRHRPKDLDGVVGQPEAVSVLQGHFDRGVFPPATIFYGPTGTGKTSLAMIVCKKLGCTTPHFVNAADDRGIDCIRDVSRLMNSSPLSGKFRIWIFDECQQWQAASQSALLNILEGTPEKVPDHVKFLLCTTDPEKLKSTLVGRCSKVKTRELTDDENYQVLLNVCKREEKFKPEKRIIQVRPEDKVLRLIAEKSEGSARVAVQKLDDVCGLKNTEDQVKYIVQHDIKGSADNIVRLLIDPVKPRWIDIIDQLKGKTNEEAENIRQRVMGVACHTLLDNGIPKYAQKEGKKIAGAEERMKRAHRILEIFEVNSPFDGGLHRLTRFCWEACNS